MTALRPSQRHYLIDVTIGDEEFLAEVTVTGRYLAALTQADPQYCYPAEFPEVEVVRLSLGERDVSGLLADSHIEALVQDACEAWAYEHAEDGPDPDAAFERARDARMDGR